MGKTMAKRAVDIPRRKGETWYCPSFRDLPDITNRQVHDFIEWLFAASKLRAWVPNADMSDRDSSFIKLQTMERRTTENDRTPRDQRDYRDPRSDRVSNKLMML